MHLQWLFFVAAAAIIIVGALVVLRTLNRVGTRKYHSPYLRRNFLFTGDAEATVFRVLVALYGETYHVLPQLHFNSLLEVDKRRVDWKDVDKMRSRLDRKAADFVLVDKAELVPRLVIELGSGAHNFPDSETRDSFLGDITDIKGLPVVTIPKGAVDKTSVQKQVEKALSGQ